MIFSSPEFCFLFLPVVAALYYILVAFDRGSDAKNWLIAASIFFYAWWSLVDAAILGCLVVINYRLTTTIIERRRAGLVVAAKRWRNVGIALNLVVLVVFKYLAFLVGLVGWTSVAGLATTIALPLGISFFTFQKIALLVDSATKPIPLPSFRDFVLFVVFFPQLIAGPIVHHREMMPQLDRIGTRRSLSLDFAVGSVQFTIGLAKKLVIADAMGPIVRPIFAAADAGVFVTQVEAWGAILAYTVQIYFDFSGYSDMALGLARMFGVRLPLNFYSPYKSVTIIDFWRRWHMTLSRFLRDYVYIPLGGNRLGARRRYVNLVLAMLLGGLWHGANWTFVAWGACHGFALAATHLAASGGARRPGAAARFASTAGTLVFVMLTWVVFRAASVGAALRLYEAAAGFNGLAPARMLGPLARFDAALHLSGRGEFILSGYDWVTTFAPRIVLGLVVALALPNSHQILRRYRPALFGGFVGDRPAIGRAIVWRPTLAPLGLTLALLFVAVLHMSDISEFLYFNF